MSSTNGLKRISATSISNTGLIRLGNNLNPGTSGQVIKSNGDIDGASWEDETPHTNERLTMGTNISLQSGNTFYDGSVAETINGATFTEGSGIEIDNNEISSLNNYFKDSSTGKIYKLLRPLDFNMDNDSGGYNRLVVADTGQEGAVQNFGTNATQIYSYFEIPNGYRFTGYYIHLTDSAGNLVGTTPTSSFFTQAGYKAIDNKLVRVGSGGSNGYNNFIDISSVVINNGHNSGWVKGNPMYQGVIMLYKLYWSSAEYIGGGYVEFSKI